MQISSISDVSDMLYWTCDAE